MNSRPAHPVVYEINTWVWLSELSHQYDRTITLGSVPREEWDRLAGLGIDALWLMGVWERSPAGIRIASQNKGLIADFKQALPDFLPEDNIGSPYCVRNYVVDRHLGGPDGLARARCMLKDLKIQLILDFVTNHVAPDHPWVMDHPEYFIQGNWEDLKRDDGSFILTGDRVFACGRDPYYPAWPDVLQLDAFHPDMRQAMIATVSEIARLCDGIRCDMAMLMLNSVFAQTWGRRAGIQPAKEFWTELIQPIRKNHPHFLFIAEAYWGLEWQLQQLGFDFCYDKRLYDRLEHGNAESVRLHLCADRSYQDRLVRFIENHDEPRAAAAFSPQRERAAAITIATIPGARLFYEGQFEGRKVRLPVFLGRRPAESLDPEIQAFYRELFKILSSDCFRNGEWRLCELSGWPDNAGYENLVAWCWKDDRERYLIVVNLSHAAVQGQVQLPWHDLNDRSWSLTDYFTDSIYEINGSTLLQPGLYVDLPPWGFHVFLLKGS